MNNIDKLMDALQLKFRYSDELMKSLATVLPVMIEYYGKETEEIIFESLLNTPIIIAKEGETILDIMNQCQSENNEGIVKEGDYKRASGVHGMNYKVVCIDGKFQVNNLTHFVGLSHHTSISLGTLVHELSHLFKSYRHPVSITGNQLIESSGVIVTKYLLEADQEIVKKQMLTEDNVGLEEGINSFDEEQIMQKIDPTYHASGYGAVRGIASWLLENESVKEDIRISQFRRENDDVLIDPNFQSISRKAEEILDLEYKKFASIFQREKMLEYNNQIIDKLGEIRPLITNYLQQKQR